MGPTEYMLLIVMAMLIVCVLVLSSTYERDLRRDIARRKKERARMLRLAIRRARREHQVFRREKKSKAS